MIERAVCIQTMETILKKMKFLKEGHLTENNRFHEDFQMESIDIVDFVFEIETALKISIDLRLLMMTGTKQEILYRNLVVRHFLDYIINLNG